MVPEIGVRGWCVRHRMGARMREGFSSHYPSDNLAHTRCSQLSSQLTAVAVANYPSFLLSAIQALPHQPMDRHDAGRLPVLLRLPRRARALLPPALRRHGPQRRQIPRRARFLRPPVRRPCRSRGQAREREGARPMGQGPPQAYGLGRTCRRPSRPCCDNYFSFFDCCCCVCVGHVAQLGEAFDYCVPGFEGQSES